MFRNIGNIDFNELETLLDRLSGRRVAYNKVKPAGFSIDTSEDKDGLSSFIDGFDSLKEQVDDVVTYKLALPWIKREEIKARIVDDVLRIEVDLEEDENWDRPFAKGGYKEISVKDKEVTLKFEDSVLTISLTPKEEECQNLEIH